MEKYHVVCYIHREEHFVLRVQIWKFFASKYTNIIAALGLCVGILRAHRLHISLHRIAEVLASALAPRITGLD